MISVIVPVYNAEHTIQSAVDSIKGDDVEIILVDDASEDKSLSVCYDIASRDSRIKVIEKRENTGSGDARNEGLKIANGEFVSFADADDLVMAGIHQSAMKAMGDADWVVWGIREIFPSGKTRDSIPLSSEIITLENQMLFGFAWNKLYRRSIITANNIRFTDTKLHEDFFFNIEYAKHSGRIITLKQIGYLYNKGDGNSVTNQFIPDYYQLAEQRIESMLDYYKQYCNVTSHDKEKNELNETVIRVLGNRYLRYLLSSIARNVDPRAGLNKADRYRRIEEIYHDRLYSEVSAECKTDNAAYRILQILLNEHKTSITDLYGKAVYRIRMASMQPDKREGMNQ